MKTRWFVSWIKRLLDSPEALEILRENSLGVEMSGIDAESVNKLSDANVGFSAHTPGMYKNPNLADPNFPDQFVNYAGKGYVNDTTEIGSEIWAAIKKSTAPVISLHAGYAAENMWKMKAFPNIAASDPLPGKQLSEIFAYHLGLFYNYLVADHDNKKLAIETLDFSRPDRQAPDRERQMGLPVYNGWNQAMECLKKYGVNGALEHCTMPSFVASVFEKARKQKGYGVDLGFLADIAHWRISADGHVANGDYEKSLDYLEEMLDVVRDRIFQIHLNVPGGNSETGFSDDHKPFGNNPLSAEILEWSREVIDQAPELEVVTLEISTDLDPVAHAKKMVEQANLLCQKLNLTV